MPYENSTTKGFPKPYLSEAKISDPIMKRVDVHHGEIGSRPAGMPDGLLDSGMSIQHVGGSAGHKN